MRLLQQSSLAARDSLIAGQETLFACGISRIVWRTSALHSPHDSEARESWAVQGEEHAPTRLAGAGPAQPQLAESVSATQRSGRSWSGSGMARRGGC
jgi:hypothetical protein